MGTKFLVYKHAMFYSTHGEIQAMQVYDALKSVGLSESFMITGFMYNTASFAHVVDMTSVLLSKHNSMHIFGKGISGFDMLVYPKQQFMNEEGTVLDIKDIVPDTLLISLNGSLSAEYIEEKTDEVEFYLVETKEDVPNIYCDTIITLPYKEESKPNFFVKQKKKSGK